MQALYYKSKLECRIWRTASRSGGWKRLWPSEARTVKLKRNAASSIEFPRSSKARIMLRNYLCVIGWGLQSVSAFQTADVLCRSQGSDADQRSCN
jgi:hypothetical protein